MALSAFGCHSFGFVFGNSGDTVYGAMDFNFFLFIPMEIETHVAFAFGNSYIAACFSVSSNTLPTLINKLQFCIYKI